MATTSFIHQNRSKSASLFKAPGHFKHFSVPLALFSLGVGYWDAFAVHARGAATRFSASGDVDVASSFWSWGASWRCLGPACSSDRPLSFLIAYAPSIPISFARGEPVSSSLLRGEGVAEDTQTASNNLNQQAHIVALPSRSKIRRQL